LQIFQPEVLTPLCAFEIGRLLQYQVGEVAPIDPLQDNGAEINNGGRRGELQGDVLVEREGVFLVFQGGRCDD
jgi:hypothetical protein